MQQKAARIDRTGAFGRADAQARLAAYGMAPQEITRVLDAAERSVEPVRDGLPWPLVDVYHGIFGFTIARHIGPRSGVRETREAHDGMAVQG